MIRSSLMAATWRSCRLAAAFLICCFLLFHTGHILKQNPKIISALTGHDNSMENPLESVLPDGMEVNNFGPNLGLQVVKDRQRNASKDELK